VLVIVEPLQIHDPMQPPPGPAGARLAAQNMCHSRGPGLRRGAPSVTSSVHSEDITANDSVSNVNLRY